MRKITSILAAAAISIGSLAVTVLPQPARAQAYTVVCEAKSPFATGIWSHPNGSFACQRALEECAIRTPSGYMCYVTRWWYA